MKIAAIENMHLDDWVARLIEGAVAASAEKVEVFLRVENMERLHWTPYQGIGHRIGLAGNMVVQMEVEGQTVTFTSDSMNFPDIESQLIQKVRELVRTPREQVKRISWSDGTKPEQVLQTVAETDAVGFPEINEMMRMLQERFGPSAFHLHRWECISGPTYTALARSDGRKMSYTKNIHSLDLLLEGEYGFLIDGEFSLRVADFRPGALVERIDRMLVWPRGETKLESSRVRLSIPPSIGSDLARKYGILFSGPRLSGSPELAGLVGKRLARPHVTLVDDALLPGGWETRAFDEEGTPSQCTALIEKGVMKQFLHSTGTAQRWGVPSTGNGVRSQNHSSSVSPSNIYFLPGETDQAQWRRQTGLGFEIVHAVQPPEFISQIGMIKFVADGWLVRDGQRERQLSSVAVTLHPFRFLRKISSFGSELTFCFNAKGAGSPTLFFDEAEVQDGQIVI